MLAFLLVLLSAPTMQPPRNKPPAAASDAGTVAPAPMSPDEIHDRIEMYLGAIHKPITPAMWQRLGPAALPELEKLAGDPAELPRRRAGAINGIAAIGSLTAPDLMLRLAKDEKQPTAVRVAALSGAGRVAPDRVAELQPVLQNATSVNVRRMAAEVLAAHGGCTAVQAQARRETEAALMSRALKICTQRK